MFKAHVSPIEVHEELFGIWTGVRAGGAIHVMLGWWRLFHTLVDEMAFEWLAHTEPSGMVYTFDIPINCRNRLSENVRW